MDVAQLQRLYMQEAMHHVNPPSFEAWLAARERPSQCATSSTLSGHISESLLATTAYFLSAACATPPQPGDSGREG